MKTFVIDDDVLSTFITENMLEFEKITQDISTFLSATDALEVIRTSSEENLPDLILLDLNMPLFDGWEFLEALTPPEQKFKRKCRIYILTSSVDKSDRLRMKEYPNVLGMFHKPISSEDIQDMFFEYSSQV